MKQVKPGRGPSFMSGINGIIAIIFGIIWTVAVAGSGAPGYFVLFDVLFVIAGIAMTIYNFSNATRKNRYSTFDITNGNEEPDQLNMRFGDNTSKPSAPQQHEGENNFCPYCGAKTDAEHAFCRRCGKSVR